MIILIGIVCYIIMAINTGVIFQKCFKIEIHDVSDYIFVAWPGMFWPVFLPILILGKTIDVISKLLTKKS